MLVLRLQGITIILRSRSMAKTMSIIIAYSTDICINSRKHRFEFTRRGFVKKQKNIVSFFRRIKFCRFSSSFWYEDENNFKNDLHLSDWCWRPRTIYRTRIQFCDTSNDIIPSELDDFVFVRRLWFSLKSPQWSIFKIPVRILHFGHEAYDIKPNSVLICVYKRAVRIYFSLRDFILFNL